MITKIYTDGSALNNADKKKRRCGCGTYICTYDTKKDIYTPIMLKGEYLEDNTNNYGELYAVYNAFKWLIKSQELKKLLPLNVEMFIDSKYVIGALDKKNKATKNKELIELLREQQKEISKIGYVIKYAHVKAHTNKKDEDSKNNDKVDKLAKECAESGKNKYKNFTTDDKN